MVTLEMPRNAVNKSINTYSYDEVLKKSIAYFQGDELAASTWMNKYAMKDKKNNFLECTPDEMHWRMAKQFARKEKEYKLKSHSNASFKYLSKYGQERELLDEKKIFHYFKFFFIQNNYLIFNDNLFSI